MGVNEKQATSTEQHRAKKVVQILSCTNTGINAAHFGDKNEPKAQAWSLKTIINLILYCSPIATLGPNYDSEMANKLIG